MNTYLRKDKVLSLFDSANNDLKLMKVLWFSLSPCGSLRRNNAQRVIQGWMISLEDEIKKHPEVSLSIAYYSDIDEDPFEYEGVTYYPMYRKPASFVLGRIYSRFKSLEEEDVECKQLLLNVVRQVTPDIIHIHGTEQNFGIITKCVRDIPICFSIQGMFAPISDRYFSGFSESDFKKYQGIYAKLRGVSCSQEFKKIRAKGYREISFIKNVSFIFGRTFWDRDICKLINPDVKYFLVNEILRDDFFDRRWSKTTFSEHIEIISILSPGQIYKGIDSLLKSAKLLSEFAQFSFTWKVIGYTESTWLLKMAEKILGYSRKDCNVEVCGIKSASELADMLSDADVYCQVSHIENSPNSLCEAMLVGIPIVATFAGGTASMLQGNGILVQDGDSYVMAGAIVNMVSDFKRAKRWSENGRRLALARHNPKSVGTELMNAYNTILKS